MPRASLPFLSLLLLTLLPPPAPAQQRNLAVVPATASAAGSYFALVIGNNAYTSLPRLQTAESDAREVAALLRDSYGFDTTLLTNATRAQIVSALSSYRGKLKPDASLLIYYAGHGYNDKEADKAYWLPVDARLDDLSNWIIADEITTALKVIPAQHVIIVADSCYSGTLSRGIGEALPRAADRTQYVQRMFSGHSRTLMASGGDEPVSDSGGGGHSVFAAAFLRGLREMDQGAFTATELFHNHVEERVVGSAEQTPEYSPLRNSGHQNGDFVFVKMKGGAAPVDVRYKLPPVSPPTRAPSRIALDFHADQTPSELKGGSLGAGVNLARGPLRFESTAGTNLIMPAGLRQVGFFLGPALMPSATPGLFCGEVTFADGDAESVVVTRPGVTGGASTPAWQMQAFDARGRPVGDLAGEGDIVTGSYLFPPVPQEFSVQGAGIHTLRICSRNDRSTFGAVPIARIVRTR
jgi:hypothetical protein